MVIISFPLQPTERYREGNCEGIGPHYNPFNVNISQPSYATNCNSTNPENCEVGDLSNKHETLTIPQVPNPYAMNAFFYTDTFLNLSSVVNRSIAIHAKDRGAMIMACAPLVSVETLSVRDISGDFTARQMNQFGNTSINSDLDASRLQLLKSVVAPNQLCHRELAADSNSVYNPHTQPNLDGNDSTSDRFPVGSLNRKYNLRTQRSVMDFPIYGIDTVAGRTLAESSANSYKCSSLWPYFGNGSDVMLAKATFNGDVGGGIYFVRVIKSQRHSIW